MLSLERKLLFIIQISPKFVAIDPNDNVSIGFSKGFVPEDPKHLPEPMLTKFHETTWHH